MHPPEIEIDCRDRAAERDLNTKPFGLLQEDRVEFGAMEQKIGAPVFPFGGRIQLQSVQDLTIAVGTEDQSTGSDGDGLQLFE